MHEITLSNSELVDILEALTFFLVENSFDSTDEENDFISLTRKVRQELKK